MTSEVSAVVFGTQDAGHLRRLLPVISGLVRAGIRTYVYAAAFFRAEIEQAGAHFMDLFGVHPIEEADSVSMPHPCRHVSFAGHYAEQIIDEVVPLKPSLVLRDTFALIGEVVARRLNIPCVNICAGHNLPPQIALEALHRYPVIRISEDCWRAVEILRSEYGMEDASPFSYTTRLSGDLNLYCEPPQYLSESERLPFHPIEFIGSLSEQTIGCSSPDRSPYGDGAADKQRLYVSFGTTVWRYFEEAARLALEAIRDAVSAHSDITALVSLGGSRPGEWVRRLELPNLKVENYVDQWNVLAASSVFITHQGLNSTHEAAFQGVPMISYPFFQDQPALAKRTQELGLAIPLAEEPCGRVQAADVFDALSCIAARRESMLARLSEARQWEMDVIAGRGQVIQHILDLIR